MNSPLRLVANLSVMFTEHSLVERAARARDAGFEEVEVWWPFGADPTPPTAEIARFVSSIEAGGVLLTAMNLYGGPAGERGVVSHPDRSDDFRASVPIAMTIAAEIGTRLFNAAYGHRRPDLDPAVQDAAALGQLSFAAEAAAAIGGTVMLEPLSDATGRLPEYPLRTAADAVSVIDRVHAHTGVSLGLLFDQYHLATNGEDVVASAIEHIDSIAHVQLADAPGRGEPGSGTADIGAVVGTLRGLGYTGAFSLEYLPTTSTLDSLASFERERARWRAQAA